jgi:hypothetical protein
MSIIVQHPQHSTRVLIPSQTRAYYTHGKVGAILSERMENNDDPTELIRHYDRKVAAHQGSFVLIQPPRHTTLTFAPYYEQEPFAEVWCIPLTSQRKKAGDAGLEPGKMTPLVLSTFLMRARTKDEMSQLIEPVEMAAWETYLATPEVTEGYDGLQQYLEAQSWKALDENVLDWHYTSETSKNGTYHYIEWTLRSPVDESEQDVLEIARMIRSHHAEHLFNEAVYRAEHAAMTTTSLPMIPAPDPLLATNGRKSSRKS